MNTGREPRNRYRNTNPAQGFEGVPSTTEPLRLYGGGANPLPVTVTESKKAVVPPAELPPSTWKFTTWSPGGYQRNAKLLGPDAPWNACTSSSRLTES